jgi:thioredoxin-like negative regulator of GroEL
MNIDTALKLARDQAESGDVKTSADDLAALLRRLSDVPTHEIEKLIDAFQVLRKQLQNAGNRIQRAAIRRASSRVSNFAAARRPDSSSK